MFQPQDSTSWYQSPVVLIIASILFPPLGLFLLWRRGHTPIATKVLASLALVVLAGGYLYLINSLRTSSYEDHYTVLEQHRAQQQEVPAESGSAPAQEQPAENTAPAQTAPAEDPSGAAGASENAAETAAAHASRNYWTNYRGPNRDGRYEEMKIATNWSAQGLPVVWKQPIGLGYASFVVADGRAYTIEQRRRQEVVAAYDLATGREVWTQSWNAEYTDSTGDGPRATPTWDNGRLYALGATGELRCLDGKTGAVVWGKNILKDNQAQNLPWAMAASPLIVDEKVIVLPGGSGGKSIVAYNKMTGAPIWRVLDDRQAYVSPMLVTLGGRRQIMVVSATRILGLAPENGSLLWSHPWATDMGINVSQPILVDKNRFFISSGYGKGAALIELTGSGNGFTARTIWENINMKNKFNSSVLHQGHVYGLDEGILTCVDVNTGERKWKGGRYGYGQVLLADGHLIVMSDSGELVLVRATPEQHSEVARFTALEGKTWNYPALAGGRLLVRNATQMACYNIAGG
ncbi:MAG TPA: PQQ-binding-like beta-propeller repeat protein [Pyrinomonadaceae bacterium]|nr:PQQ-binding-like beta-propeller repeat protein [Pyrinomonadaceae bacterium]